jgi:hypothetical protein
MKEKEGKSGCPNFGMKRKSSRTVEAGNSFEHAGAGFKS